MKDETYLNFIEPELWGKDHISTLAYIETKIVDFGHPYVIEDDVRMRTDKHNWRIANYKTKPHRRLINFMDGEKHGSRLNNGTSVPRHDDWDCLQDIARYGIFNIRKLKTLDVGKKIKLSKLGLKLCNSIRNHKATGGNFSNYIIPEEIRDEMNKKMIS